MNLNQTHVESLIKLFNEVDSFHLGVRIERIKGKYKALGKEHTFYSDAVRAIEQSFVNLQNSIK